MKLGNIVENVVVPPHPKGVVLDGVKVRLEPLKADTHANDLFESNSIDQEGSNWAYLPYGPFEMLGSFSKWLKEQEPKDDPSFFSIIRKSDEKAVGVASFLRINPKDFSIEVGHIHYSPLLQGTREGTEAMFLMMKWVFENGYRRYEYKCNALNRRSRSAAGRLGFAYEGVFRQMMIAKGRNRDTAWFAAIDKEWKTLRQCYIKYLSEDNFTEESRQKIALSSLTKPILYKKDNMDCA